MRAARQKRADVLLPVSEAIHDAAARLDVLRREIAVAPVPSVDIFNAAVDKSALAEIMAEHNIPSPPTVCCQPGAQLEQALGDLPFPALLKPAQGSDGSQIRRFETAAALLEFLDQNPDCTAGYLIQSYLEGYDISCGVLCQQGRLLAHTMQRATILRPRPFASPAGIQFIKDEQTFEIISRLFSVLNWNGIANVDLRYEQQTQQVAVLEINPRFWGSLLGSLRAGVNFPYLACLAALGIPFPQPDYRLCSYVAGVAAFRNGLLGGGADYTFSETSWRYGLADPWAEGFKLLRHFLTHKVWIKR